MPRGVETQDATTLLLTGAPGIGKTTIVMKVAAALPGRRLRGFVTGEIRRGGRRVGFELTTFSGHKRVLAHVEIDSPHRVGHYGVDVAALDEICEDALALQEGADIYLVDEVGKMECFSAKFRAAICRLLDSGRPLVATVALRGPGFIADVKNRRDVEVWTATKETRDGLPDQIVKWASRTARKK